MKALQLWFRILEAQMETGTPYMLYKETTSPGEWRVGWAFKELLENTSIGKIRKKKQGKKPLEQQQTYSFKTSYQPKKTH